MAIKVVFFARLRELSGHSEVEITLPTPTTPAEIWRHISPNQSPPEPLLVAINQDYAQMDSQVEDNQEVAFFPPVTGG